MAAISVGIIDGEPRLDLPYEEDVRAETDMNVVMTGDGAFVEVQGTAEGEPFDRADARQPARAGGEGLRRPDRDAAGGAGADEPAGLPRLPQREEARRDAADPRRVRPRRGGARARRRRAVRRAGGDRADASPATPCSRRAPPSRRPGCRRWPTTAGCASTRSTACPACCRRAGPASAKDDPANNRLLLEQLADVPDERRGAHFRCAVAFAYPVGAGGVAEHVVHGEMPGRVIREMRGDGGFGYDVLFVARRAATASCTSAELSAEEKDAISHRGKALREIAPVVADVLTGL